MGKTYQTMGIVEVAIAKSWLRSLTVNLSSNPQSLGNFKRSEVKMLYIERNL